MKDIVRCKPQKYSPCQCYSLTKYQLFNHNHVLLPSTANSEILSAVRKGGCAPTISVSLPISNTINNYCYTLHDHTLDRMAYLIFLIKMEKLIQSSIFLKEQQAGKGTLLIPSSSKWLNNITSILYTYVYAVTSVGITLTYTCINISHCIILPGWQSFTNSFSLLNIFAVPRNSRNPLHQKMTGTLMYNWGPLPTPVQSDSQKHVWLIYTLIILALRSQKRPLYPTQTYSWLSFGAG